MSVRQWLNDNPQVTVAVTLVVVVGALMVMAIQFRGAGTSAAREVYFWDVQADEAYVAPEDAVPPIEAPSGGEGVRAHLYTCGECVAEQWFGYLETYTPEARRQYETAGEVPTGDQQRVRALDGERWVDFTSTEGQRILDRIYAVYEDETAAPCNEPGVPPRQCLP